MPAKPQNKVKVHQVYTWNRDSREITLVRWVKVTTTTFLWHRLTCWAEYKITLGDSQPRSFLPCGRKFRVNLLGGLETSWRKSKVQTAFRFLGLDFTDRPLHYVTMKVLRMRKQTRAWVAILSGGGVSRWVKQNLIWAVFFFLDKGWQQGLQGKETKTKTEQKGGGRRLRVPPGMYNFKDILRLSDYQHLPVGPPC